MDVSFLKSIVPGIVSMKANTALCFLFGGFSLWLYHTEKQNTFKRICLTGFPILLILTGALTLFQYIFKINFGIDEFLFKDAAAVATSSPGRMAPTTALCFVLSGISLLLLHSSKAFQLFQICCILVFSIGLLALLGYVYEVKYLQGGMSSYTKMAVHTSIAFILFSISVISSKPGKGVMSIITDDGITGIAVRKLLPVIFFVPLILGWLRLEGQRAGYYDTEFGVAVYAFITIVILSATIFWGSINLLSIDKEKNKKAEELKKSNELFSSVFNEGPVMNVITDAATGKYLEVNDNFVQFIGFKKEELIGKTSLDLNLIPHPEHRAEIINNIRKNGFVKDVTTEVQGKDRETKWVSTSARGVTISGKDVFLSTMIDVTERKKTEEQLKNSNDLFSDLFNLNPSAIAISRMDNAQIININKSFLKLFGFRTKEDVIGKTSAELNILTDPEQRIELVRQIKETNKVVNLEGKIKTMQGAVKWLSTFAHVIEVDNISCILAVMLDITERKKAEEQIISVNKELESFSYSVSHDLRAPLRAISGYSTILLEDYAAKMDEDGAKALHSMVHNSKKMGELIDDLLAFSRLGRKQITTAELNMTALVKSVREEESAGNENKIEFTITDLPPAKGDMALIRQAWINLISNAIKYSKHKPKTSIEIGANKKNNFVEYYIKDNGAGFDMQYYDKLFGVFQRLHSAEEFEGTGIGLAIVQKIIQRHHGTIRAEAKVNEGACFYFTLPGIG